jgi:hypothetical protein
MSASLRKRPKCCVAASPLFDHLIGEREQLVGDFEAECLRGPKIDHEFKFRGLLDRQVGWLLALENATGVDAAGTDEQRTGPTLEFRRSGPPDDEAIQRPKLAIDQLELPLSGIRLRRSGPR